MPVPRVISLDIESYGKLTGLPRQTCFSPARCFHVDGATPANLVVSVAITVPQEDPRCPAPPAAPPKTPSPSSASSATSATTRAATAASPTPAPQPAAAWSAPLVARLRPGPTFLLTPSTHPSHLHLLLEWLLHADTLIGMNLQYDIAHLRAAFPLLRPALSGHHTILDLSYVAFLEYELRPERSLKNLGPLTSLFRYEEEDLEEKLPTLDKILAYNAQDTHNTILAVSHFASRIASRFSLPAHIPSLDYGRPNTEAKLSPFCLTLYSETIWCVQHMSEMGLPFHLPSLQSLRSRCETKIARCEALALQWGLQLSGEGRDTPANPLSRPAFLNRMVSAIDATRPPSAPSIASDPLLYYTPAKRTLSFSDGNRSLLASHLSPTIPSHRRLLSLCRLIDIHASASKLLSTWVLPALAHKSRKPSDRTELLCPPPSPLHRQDVGIDHPSWYIVPGRYKDSSDKEGGTIQARITCRKGPRQTDPPPVQDCYCSRYPSGLLVSLDIDQAEVRVPTLLSGDPSMVTVFQQGQDIHTRRALTIWSHEELVRRHPALASLDIDSWKKHGPFKARERQVGKRVVLSDGFRAGAERMQKSVLSDIGETLPLSLFEQIVRTRPLVRPVLWAWQERLIQTARRDGHLTLPFTGQTRHFAPSSMAGNAEYDINEICNFPVQTTAANVLLRLMHLLRRSLSALPVPIHIIHNVYDSLIFDVPHPSLLPTLRSHIAAAHHHLTTADYWHRLSLLHNTQIPLTYELKVLPPPTLLRTGKAA